MRVVLTLGSSLTRPRGEAVGVEDQRTTVRLVCQALAPVVAQHELVITIGDGLQVSLLALQGEEAGNGVGLSDMHYEMLTGYMIQQELGNLLAIPRPISTVLISSEVDPEDPAFQKPTKAVGPFYNKAQAQRLLAEKRWSIVPDGDRYRRVVPSLLPTRIVESRPIGWLLQRNTIVICAGGGGVPVIRNKHQKLQAVDGAAVDRDRASAVLATQLRADLLVLATEADAVYLDWETSGKRAIRRASPAALQSCDFDVDSIGPKVEAACEFAELTEKIAVIGALRDIEAMVQGEKGTSVAMDYKDLEFGP